MPALSRVLLAALLVPALACRSSRSGPAAAAPAPKAAAPAPAASVARPAASAITDANIAAIVVAANNADITFGQLALGRSGDAAVKQYATMTVKDHSGLNAAAVALVTKLRVTPQDNQASLDLRDDADTQKDRLRELSGAAFDLAYAQNEARYHAMVLEVIEGTLIPSARNGELKALLESAVPAVRMHLRAAALLEQTLRQR